MPECLFSLSLYDCSVIDASQFPNLKIIVVASCTPLAHLCTRPTIWGSRRASLPSRLLQDSDNEVVTYIWPSAWARENAELACPTAVFLSHCKPSLAQLCPYFLCLFHIVFPRTVRRISVHALVLVLLRLGAHPLLALRPCLSSFLHFVICFSPTHLVATPTLVGTTKRM